MHAMLLLLQQRHRAKSCQTPRGADYESQRAPEAWTGAAEHRGGACTIAAPHSVCHIARPHSPPAPPRASAAADIKAEKMYLHPSPLFASTVGLSPVSASPKNKPNYWPHK